jgi:hypothetical protein
MFAALVEPFSCKGYRLPEFISVTGLVGRYRAGGVVVSLWDPRSFSWHPSRRASIAGTSALFPSIMLWVAPCASGSPQQRADVYRGIAKDVIHREGTFTLAPWKPSLEPTHGRVVTGRLAAYHVLHGSNVLKELRHDFDVILTPVT